jgi:hypothetical protein
MRARPLAPIAAALALAATSPAAGAERVVDVATRPGITVRVLVGAPDGPPRAAALLFAGGHGGLRLGPDGSIAWGKRNFVVRTRERLGARGIATVVVDAPSDRRELGVFRATRDHAADVAAVIRWARQALAVPVWLVGTSRGSVSVANAAAALAGGPDSPDGIVLSSSILDDPRSASVLDFDLGKVRVPALVVHHRADGCPVCPPALVPRLERRLANAARREVVLVSGGVSEGGVCEAVAHHGYNGIEEDVIAAVARFVLADAPARSPGAPTTSSAIPVAPASPSAASTSAAPSPPSLRDGPQRAR